MDVEELGSGLSAVTTERPRSDLRSTTLQSTATTFTQEQSNVDVNGPRTPIANEFAGLNATASIDLDAVVDTNNRHSGINGSSGEPQTEAAHEIGLIPLSSGVNKYVGPSSGFPFAKLVFARADQASPGTVQSNMSQDSPSTVRSRPSFQFRPTAIPTSREQALELSKTYFEYVHVQYPFLHEPSHYRLLNEVYNNSLRASSSALFQITMVLAISATILSKSLRIPFTGEGLCATAMEHANKLDFQNSVNGVQCLLLIAMFTLHSPYLAINPWYLNYQCLAAVLDLGLQRNIPISTSVSSFEREMRTRIFWVIYSIDRILATTLGRPIGLRDEGCDLRVSQCHSPNLNYSRLICIVPFDFPCEIFRCFCYQQICTFHYRAFTDTEVAPIANRGC